MGARRLTRAVIAAILGVREELPSGMLERYPELRDVRVRRGGLPPRMGGWCLGASTVSGITLWRTIWLGVRAPADPGLLLHELRHVHQFQSSRIFPLAYAWESVRRGYHANRYEVDARAFAARRLRETGCLPP